MKKTSLMIRILSLVMVLCMSFAMMSVTAFAAEDNGTGLETPTEPDRSVGPVLYAGSQSFINSVTISLYMSNGDWSTDFLVLISGNTGALYEVNLITPGGTTYTAFVNSGTGQFTNIKTLAYASSGTYTFVFTRISGNAVAANAVAEICD